MAETTKSDKLILYHGSKAGIEGSIAPISRVRCDFGAGFYMGTERQQPLTLICTNEKPVLYTVELDLNGLNVLEYDTANAEIMNMCWPAYHTLDVEMAIDRLKKRDDDDRKRNDLREMIYAFLKETPDSSWNEIADGIRDHSIWAYKIISEMEDGPIVLSSIEPLQNNQESLKYKVTNRIVSSNSDKRQQE